ncbi:hypothetical protein O3M35_010550 [Rhynocoris fuscipes]|uniref:Uncharacterized protein n=1 Tax=Rhynocoris fuscipes TaxID=488301 RepID=A0AAW1D0P8_9HEMI
MVAIETLGALEMGGWAMLRRGFFFFFFFDRIKKYLLEAFQRYVTTSMHFHWFRSYETTKSSNLTYYL